MKATFSLILALSLSLLNGRMRGMLTMTASISSCEKTSALVLQYLSGKRWTSSATSLSFMSTFPSKPLDPLEAEL